MLLVDCQLLESVITQFLLLSHLPVTIFPFPMCQPYRTQNRLILWTTSFLSLSLVVTSYQQTPPPRHSRDNEPIMKAWHCHGRSQRDLVDRLRQARIVKTPAVQQVMEVVDRQYYTADSNLSGGVNPYLDTPQGIGKSQTISAPHMHAHALEEILPALKRNAATKEGRPVKVLDVGSGSGYLTACMGRWFSAKVNHDDPSSTSPILPFPGLVYGMDIHPELVEFTTKNIQKNDGDLLSSHTITLRHGNGWMGWPEEAPFDAIHVGAAAESFPAELARQLTLHGVLIVPVGPTGNVQSLLKVERVADTNKEHFVWEDFHVTQLLGVRYVPLVQRPE